MNEGTVLTYWKIRFRPSLELNGPMSVNTSLPFFFKQKTASEISTRDWSSDVCSSDLDLRADRVSASASAQSGDTVHVSFDVTRSEERRVGKEWRSRWSPYHQKKKSQGGQRGWRWAEAVGGGGAVAAVAAAG